MKSSTSVNNIIDAGSGLSTQYTESAENTLSWDGLQSATLESLQSGENSAFGHLHPFPSLKKLWQMNATLQIPLSTMQELFAVNSAAFVETEYPATGATYEATTTQEELVAVKVARIWAICLWSAFLVATLAATIFFSMQLSRSDDDSDKESLLDPDSPKPTKKEDKFGLQTLGSEGETLRSEEV